MKNIAIAVGLLALCGIFGAPSHAETMGGGDPSGCYASKAAFATPQCQQTDRENQRTVLTLTKQGWGCVKTSRDWRCSKEGVTILIPHEGRLTH